MIYDTFTFFNELDLLEIRLEELFDVVDRFVLVEATQTFQGDPKPLYFKENQKRFERFLPKITHLTCDFPEDPRFSSKKFDARHIIWRREFFQRNYVKNGFLDASPDDLIMVSDVDEILKKNFLINYLKNRRRGRAVIFGMPTYSFRLNLKVFNHVHHGPKLIEFKHFTGGQKLRVLKHSINLKGGFIDLVHTKIRNFHGLQISCPVDYIDNSGWHFTSIGSWQDYRNKINAYSHYEYKEKEIYISEGKFLRSLLNDHEKVDYDEMPIFVQRNTEKFRSILV